MGAVARQDNAATVAETKTNWSKGIVGVTNVARSGVKIVTGVQQVVGKRPTLDPLGERSAVR